MSEVISSLYTFLLYLIVLSPSLLMTKQATIKVEKGRKKRFVVASLFAIAIPCIFSGMRSENVGVDLLGYAMPVYRMAEKASSLSYFWGLTSRFEVGYRTIAYVAAHVFHSFNVHLFLTQLFINTPIYCGAMVLRKRFQPWIVMLSFYCLFYVETFNIMRQGIGVAFGFLSFALLVEKKYRSSILIALTGYLFHTTMIIGYALIAFIYLFRRIKSRSVKIFLIVGLTISVPLAMHFWEPALIFLAAKGLVPTQYVRYFITNQVAYFRELGTKNYFELVVRWLGVLIPLLFRKRIFKNKDDINYTLFFGVLFATLIYTSVFIFLHSSYGYRISFYLEILFILWLPSMYKKRARPIGDFKIPLSNIIMFSSLILCFYIGYMLLGLHRTLPFHFQIY